MGKPAVSIDLTRDERAELEGLARRRQTAQGLARLAEIVFLAADGLQNKEIVARLGKDASTAGRRRRRFAQTIRKTLEETPADATHGSLRSMARAAGQAPSTVHRQGDWAMLQAASGQGAPEVPA